jgi:nuclear pore complex protein Nup155
MAPGAVELPLNCAQLRDPDNIGLEYWYAGSPANDPRSEFYEKRLQCYDLVLDSLGVFEEKSNSSATTDNARVGAGDDPETVRSHAFELAFLSKDEMFHSTLYEWLINRSLADELLEVWRPASNTVITHLISLSSCDPLSLKLI